MSAFYLTTPIYYVNDKPHLGTAYCTIVADVLARYHRLFGDDTIMLTGVDEHGQKVQEAAEKRGMDPQAHCDEMSERFKSAWQDLNIKYDVFFRTTTPYHKQVVQICLKELFDKGEIYADEYEGWYSVSEEIFYTEKDLVDGKSPSGREVVKIKEKNYFFRMSKYQQALIDHIQKYPDFIWPESRRNEVLGFLRQPLADLCISRPKSRLKWGVELPFDQDYVTYVWFDALLNYATAMGLKQNDRQTEFKKWWHETGAIHLIGKDILTTHAVYWTTMLFALGLDQPKHIFAHGWILNKDMEKMSKSKGEVVNPLDMKNYVGVDGLRYFLIRDVHLGNDAPFSPDLLINRVNNDLANNLGNMTSRTLNLIEKFFAGAVPAPETTDHLGDELKAMALTTGAKVKHQIEKMAPSYALEAIVETLNLANRYLEERAPWKLAKSDLAATATVLYNALEVLRISATLLLPVMPEKMDELLKRLGNPSRDWAQVEKWGVIKVGTPVTKGDPLFPRLELPS
ncbi:MAG: methionine--tRNA ligase [Bdellovibrionales bacterium]